MAITTPDRTPATGAALWLVLAPPITEALE
jgi:hypothetical protein